MENANHFIRCAECGGEFKSMVAGASVAIGNVESCPFCGSQVISPHLVGDLNMDLLQDAAAEPMIREYGENGKDGYVFMGRGHLQYEIRASKLVPVLAAYDRNIRRALELLDIYYEVDKVHSQVVLSTVFISTMTAYECLTDDLLLTMQRMHLIATPKGRPPFHRRRDLLFAALGLKTDDHVKALRYLYAFRNCLTHNAGVIDDDFIDNIRAINPDVPLTSTYVIGERLRLEPSVATSVADSLQQIAHTLLPAAQVLVEASKAGR